MSVDSVKRRGQEMAQRQMHDRIDHLRPTGGYTDDGSGNLVADVTTVNADVPAWIRQLPNQVQIKESGGQPVTLMAYDVLLPHETEDIRLDDLFRVTTSGQVDLQGQTLTVIDPAVGTHQVARRIMTQIQSGGA